MGRRWFHQEADVPRDHRCYLHPHHAPFGPHDPHDPLGTHRTAASPRLRPLVCAGKEMRMTYFKRARECTDSDLNSVKLYEYK